MSMIRGACPSIDRPMQTGDGLLTRLTPLSGSFTPAELTSVAGAAKECGNGILEVSTRGNLQVRGLSQKSLPTFMSRIDDAKLALNRNIPVVVNPLAGCDPSEITDPRALQARLRMNLKETDLFERLSPKTSIIIDSGSSTNLSHLIGDIRLKACRTRAGVKWQLHTGGIEARSHVVGVALDDDAALAAVTTLLERISERGIMARGRDLESHDHSCVSTFIDPDGQNTMDAQRKDHMTEHRSLIGLEVLKSGAYAVRLAPAYGTTNTEQMLMLANAAKKAGADKIEPAPSKTILISEMDEKAANEFSRCVEAEGFITDPNDPRLAIITCAGSPACNSGSIHTHNLADEIAHEFRQDLKGDLCIHISACEKRCAQPGREAIEIIGGKTGLKISATRASEENNEANNEANNEGSGDINIAHDQLMPALQKLLKNPNP